MRKSKRFIKKFSERFIVYIVVFVAFVNACFFVPMAVQASPSSSFTASMYFGEGTASTPILTVNDSSYVNYAYNKAPSSGRYSPVVSFEINSNDFLDGNYFVLQFTLTWSVNIQSSGSMEVGHYYNSFYVFRPILGYAQYGEIDDNTTVVVDDDYDGHIYGNNNISFSLLRSSVTNNGVGYTGSLDIAVSGYYDYTTGIGFSFEPHVDLSGSGYGWLMLGFGNVSLDISGTSTSDSQNLQDLVNGYNDSTGNQVSSDFESGVNDYDQAEDNLFNTSTGALQGFEFFDFGSFSAVTSGLSFCSSLLTSIYENFGGLNGIGIVISVLFSVLFMAIVIGLFRYYK